jgi:hypothetical protein
MGNKLVEIFIRRNIIIVKDSQSQSKLIRVKDV